MVADKEAIINNIFYHNSLKTKSAGTKELLSVTVVKQHDLTSEDLQAQVERDLNAFCGIETLRCIKHYKIPKALPKLDNLQYEMRPSTTRLTNRIYLAGDLQLNASLNAAMIAGERAAIGVVEAVLAE